MKINSTRFTTELQYKTIYLKINSIRFTTELQHKTSKIQRFVSPERARQGYRRAVQTIKG